MTPDRDPAGLPAPDDEFWQEPDPESSADPEWFLDVVDGAAPPRAHGRAPSRDIARRLASYRRAVDALAALGRQEAEEDGGPALRARILAAVREEATPVPVVSLSERRSRMLALMASGSLAAAALLLFFVLNRPSKVDGDAGPSKLAIETKDGFRDDGEAERPRELHGYTTRPKTGQDGYDEAGRLVAGGGAVNDRTAAPQRGGEGEGGARPADGGAALLTRIGKDGTGGGGEAAAPAGRRERAQGDMGRGGGQVAKGERLPAATAPQESQVKPEGAERDKQTPERVVRVDEPPAVPVRQRSGGNDFGLPVTRSSDAPAAQRKVAPDSGPTPLPGAGAPAEQAPGPQAEADPRAAAKALEKAGALDKADALEKARDKEGETAREWVGVARALLTQALRQPDAGDPAAGAVAGDRVTVLVADDAAGAKLQAMARAEAGALAYGAGLSLQETSLGRFKSGVDGMRMLDAKTLPAFLFALPASDSDEESTWSVVRLRGTQPQLTKVLAAVATEAKLESRMVPRREFLALLETSEQTAQRAQDQLLDRRGAPAGKPSEENDAGAKKAPARDARPEGWNGKRSGPGAPGPDRGKLEAGPSKVAKAERDEDIVEIHVFVRSRGGAAVPAAPKPARDANETKK